MALEPPTSNEVAVVGSCFVDFCIRVPRLPGVGETVLGTELTTCLGGKGANQAVALARLGVAASMIGRVGDDAHGAAFRAMFESEGIEHSGVAADPAHATGLGIPMILADGANAIVVAPSAAMRLSTGDVERAAGRLLAARLVLMQLEGPREALLFALELCKGAGVPVFLNPAPVVPFAREAVRLADVAMPNQVEAEHLVAFRIASVHDALAAADELRRHGPRVAIVTLGADGAVIASDEYTGHVPGFGVRAVDTTGAGDAFCAGLVWSRLAGHGWRESVVRANACGALATTRAGTGPAMPTSDAVAAFLRGAAG